MFFSAYGGRGRVGVEVVATDMAVAVVVAATVCQHLHQKLWKKKKKANQMTKEALKY